ncbi:T9SS type A sorting domain-containing protein [Taibaiella koreensis]|uniref:T9SS type A sorting domain-containing protein n=1 Tax=Taibaiella koreensis TaxID=1268548 RepID=UPI000E59FE00|nr:T9SS type A sorting domain-containing protein [Taibaiella koreensis]
MNKNLLLTILLLLGWHTGIWAQSVPDNAEGRLWRLCKVWGYLKYYSPRTCQLNWDSLLRVNVPLVKNAATNTEFNDHINDLLQYVGQIPTAQTSLPPVSDSNLNLQLGWVEDIVFSAAVRGFLDTFNSRAGHNDSLACRVKLNDRTDPAFTSFVDFRKDQVGYTTNFNLETDRLVTLFFHWNVFNYFGPYRRLANQNWDSVLLNLIPEAIAVPGGIDFTKVLAKLQSRKDDSHAFLSAFVWDRYLGSFYAGLKLKKVEGRIIVAKVRPEVAGVAMGDELLAIDGMPVDGIIGSYPDLFAASNPSSFYRDACNLLVRGNGPTSYTFRNASSQTFTVTVDHTIYAGDWYQWWSGTPGTPAWSTLCNGYGYVHMGRLQRAQVTQMYEELKDKPAIVFDVRNYPNGTMIDLARYLFHEPVITARVFQPDPVAPGWFTVINDSTNLGTWSNPNPYSGRLYFLVNEETQSHAEYTVQYLSHVPGAKVIGSQTAGADGNVNIILDRNIYFYFTGLGWYYDDWYQCQRNGIKIDEVVTPTIAGIRAGRDEVLESITGCPTGVSNAAPTSLAVSLYPNPAADQLTLHIGADGDEVLSLRISDVVGKICYRMAGKNVAKPGGHIAIDVHALPAGVYFLDMRSATGKVFTTKFVKR